QLADDAVDRMMNDEPPAEEPPAVVVNPVQALTSQLDTFFEELRQRQAEAAAVIDAIPEAEPISINDAERAALDAPSAEDDATALPSPRRLLDPIDEEGAATWRHRVADRVGAPIESLSPWARGLISVTAV